MNDPIPYRYVRGVLDGQEGLYYDTHLRTEVYHPLYCKKHKDEIAMLWSEDLAIQRAEQKARLRRIPLRKYTSYYDEDNVRWNKRLGELQTTRPLDIEQLDWLEYTKYITVHYKPILPYEGPDLWVFIDAKTTKVIESYKGCRN